VSDKRAISADFFLKTLKLTFLSIFLVAVCLRLPAAGEAEASRNSEARLKAASMETILSTWRGISFDGRSALHAMRLTSELSDRMESIGDAAGDAAVLAMGDGKKAAEIQNPDSAAGINENSSVSKDTVNEASASSSSSETSMDSESASNPDGKEVSGSLPADGRTFENISEGSAGGFGVPDLGINVQLYSTPLEADGGTYAQAIVDAEGQAACFNLNSHTCIADHYNQGFEAINDAVPDSTHAIFIQNGVPTEYVCVANIQGHNIESDLTDDAYNPIDSICPGALVLYTCHGCWQNITITFWMPC
jgi:hypothetical protein